MLSARREEQAQERRRLQALTEALRARGLASDPQGKLFHAAQQKAIAARRAENARLANFVQNENEPASEEFSLSRLDTWDDAVPPAARRARRGPVTWLAALLVVASACAAATVAYPDIWRHLTGA